jgi:hypothetical protein
MATPGAEVASESEIEAALADAQAHADRIPSLEEREESQAVRLPFERPAPLPSQPFKEVIVEEQEAAEPAPAASAAPAQRRSFVATIGWSAFQVADGLLASVNWPFRWLPSRARQLVGLAAIATLVTSLLALLVLHRR